MDQLIHAATPPAGAEERIARAERRARRERAARLAAEEIAERGLRDLWASRQQLLLLQRVTDGANQTDDVRAALKLAIDELCAHTGWEFGNAYLRDGDALVACDTWWATDPAGMAAFIDRSRRYRFTAGAGLPGRVLAEVRPHWVEDVTADTNFPRAPLARAAGLRAGCAFPVLAGAEVVAVLEFLTTRRLAPDPDLVTLMAQVGTQIGRVVERDRARQSLIRDALHDPLTGLPNRSLFADRFRTAFARARAHDPAAVAVLVLDLDGFKAVNDRRGHAAGDDLLVRAVAAMAAALAGEEARAAAAGGALRATLARMGGDEFTILLEDLAGPDDIARVADALHAALRPAAPDQAHATASIGVAHGTARYHDPEQMLHDADLAMYEAKAGGRNRTVTLDETVGRQIRERLRFEQELRHALAAGEFVLHFQPIMAVAAGAVAEIAGFEALVRWHHPARGLVGPAEFIPLAEETGLILPLGDWVLRAACRAAAEWHRALAGRARGGAAPFVSVNVSPRQFLQADFAARVAGALDAAGLAPAALRLEITEHAAVRDAERTRAMMNEIRSWGIKTSLDDFGTGYSSLGHLQRLPFDVLKIDRSFIAGLGREASARGIVQAILDLARALGMGVVAEGVEHAHQAALLRELGCGQDQGFLYSRPVPAADALELLLGG